MKLNKHKEKKLLSKWVAYGYHFRRFSLEFTIDKYQFVISLGFVYLTVEF